MCLGILEGVRTNLGGNNKEKGPFTIDVKGGEKMKKKDPSDRGSNDRVNKLEDIEDEKEREIQMTRGVMTQ